MDRWGLDEALEHIRSVRIALNELKLLRVGSKYTFWDQIQIQLSQIKYKYITFLDFNSNKNTLIISDSNTWPF